MKWVTYFSPQQQEKRAGFLLRNMIFDLQVTLDKAGEWLTPERSTMGALQPDSVTSDQLKAIASEAPIPSTMLAYLDSQDTFKQALQRMVQMLQQGSIEELEQHEMEHVRWFYPFDQVQLCSPLPCPRSFRDFYAFEEHVQTARAKRGLGMVQEWYEFPVFYFSNHQAILGSGEEIQFPIRSKKWDYELEIGIVIGKEGRNIPREDAFQYIFGLTIINDWSARDIQAQEVKVGLGPAKGKDFGTSIGPFIVTPEEWVDRKRGEHIDLSMEAYVNGKRMSKGNLNQLYWSIPQLLERASEDCTLYPGDVIGTGTVGTGCLLEQEHPVWLQSGDEIQFKVERLGILNNWVK